MKKTEIFYLIRQFYRIQEHRIAFGGQIRALKKQKMNLNPLDEYFEDLQGLEKRMAKYISNSIKDEDIWINFLKKVKGIGPILGANLINLIDIKEAKHISSLWKFAGLDVVNGAAPKRKRGVVSTWNPLMRNLCWKIGNSLVRSNSPYRKFFDERKEHEKVHHPELKKFHIDRRARRYMVKRFLSDLWLAWRKQENLPISQPYVVAQLGHSMEPSIIREERAPKSKKRAKKIKKSTYTKRANNKK